MRNYFSTMRRLILSAGPLGRERSEPSIQGQRVGPRPHGIPDFPGYSFEQTGRFRPFDLLSKDFPLASFRPDPSDSLRLFGGLPVTVPFLTFEIRTGQSSSGAGLIGDQFSVYGCFDPASRTQQIVAVTEGTARVLAAAPWDSVETAAVTITENVVTLWLQQGQEWSATLTYRLNRDDGIDLRTAASSGKLYPATIGSPDFVRLAIFGYTGLRDPQLIKHADGTPFTRDGLLLATATCAGPGPFPTAHWGIFTIDPADPSEIAQIGHLFFERNRRVLGDHAGHIVIDEDGSAIVLVSSWGDFSDDVHIRHLRAGPEILSGIHTLPSEPLPLPTSLKTWDPTLQHYQGHWWLGFVECQAFTPRFDFRPALARGNAGDPYDGPYTYVGADTVHHQTEGTLLTPVGNETYLFASDGDAKEYPVYDLNMDRVAQLQAPYSSNIPHPMLIATDDITWMLTFDGTPIDNDVLGYGTHGDILIYRSKGV